MLHSQPRTHLLIPGKRKHQSTRATAHHSCLATGISSVPGWRSREDHHSLASQCHFQASPPPPRSIQETAPGFLCPCRARSARRVPASAWYLPEPCLTEPCWVGSQGQKRGEGSSGVGALWPVSWFDVSLEWRPVFRRLIGKGQAHVACSADSPPTGPGHSLAEAASFEGQRAGVGQGLPAAQPRGH